MRIAQKITAVFIAISLLVGFVGFFGLYTNKQIVSSFESGERHFGAIIVASTEVSSYAKRAEGHAMLYITLHNESDKQKFQTRIESLRNQTAILDKETANPEARKIVEAIKSKTGELQFVGESLIAAHDNETGSGRGFEPENHKELILSFSKLASGIREDGVNLVELETRLKTEQEQAAEENAGFLYNIVFVIGVIAVFFALLLGYFISRKIANPLAKLTNLATDIGKGSLDTKTEVKSKDEIGELSQAFNKMTLDLKNSKEQVNKYTEDLEKSKKLLEQKVHERTKELGKSKDLLQNYNKRLQKDVEERTKELETKLIEVERFSRLSVGRELKMIELKNKISKLETLLREHGIGTEAGTLNEEGDEKC